MLAISFGPAAIQDGKVHLFVSESIVKQLGAQRIIPSPVKTVVGDGGLTYTFLASRPPTMVEFALQPDGPGAFPFLLQVPGFDRVSEKVVVCRRFL